MNKETKSNSEPLSAGMAKTVCNLIMWLAWSCTSLLNFMMAFFLTKHTPQLNSFTKRFGILAAGMFVIPVLICGVMRFLISLMSNPWLALLPFFIGLFFAWQAGLYGIFLFPEFFIVFHLLGVVLLIAYLPAFVKLRPTQTMCKRTTL